MRAAKAQSSRELDNRNIHFFTNTRNKIPQHCPSLYKQENLDNEHSPILFEEHDVVVCRTPKVASLELRSIAESFHSNTSFKRKRRNRPYTGNHSLAHVHNENEFHRYLYSADVTRVMFVRHPVMRMLSGFLEVARFNVFWTKIHTGMNGMRGNSPQAFHTWVKSGAFRQHYHSTCNANSTSYSLNRAIQHWAPPQYCRCGIHECNVEWTVYKLEDIESVGSVLGEYLPSRHLPLMPNDDDKNGTMHKRQYNVTDYLTQEVLSILNEATREEQEYFGYRTLDIRDFENG